MLTYACPACRRTMHAVENEIGRMIACPQCGAQTQVPFPLGPEGPSNAWVWVLVAGVIAAIGLPMLLVVFIAAVSLIGTNSSTTFSKVGGPIAGSTTTAGSAPRNAGGEAADAADTFMTFLVEGMANLAYTAGTSDDFQKDMTLEVFVADVNSQPGFRGKAVLSFDPQATRGAAGDVTFKGRATAAMGTTRFVVKVKQTKSGWKVDELSFDD